MSKTKNHPPSRRHDFRRRLFVVSGIFILYGFAIIGKLFYLQIFQHHEFLAQSKKQYVQPVKISYGRGAIMDRNGNELATNLETESVYINPSGVRDKRYTARILSGIFGLK